MKTRVKRIGILAAAGAALVLPVRSGAVDLPGGPFDTRNEHTICRLYGLPEDLPTAGPEAGWSLRAAADWANNSLVKVRGNDVLVLDGETLGLRFGVSRRWANGWSAGLGIPLTSHQGGSLDRFIREYHDALGLPDGNRWKREPDRLEYVGVVDGQEAFRLDHPATGVGDIRLATAFPLWQEADGRRRLTGTAGLKLPTGDPERLLGSGSTDVSAALVWHDGEWLRRWRLEADAKAGAVLMSKGDILPDRQRSAAAAGSLSLGWNALSWLQPRIQADGHSPLFRNTGIDGLDEWAAGLAMGARIALPGAWRLDVAVVEDLIVNSTPDVVFHVSIWR